MRGRFGNGWGLALGAALLVVLMSAGATERLGTVGVALLFVLLAWNIVRRWRAHRERAAANERRFRAEVAALRASTRPGQDDEDPRT